MAQTTEQQIEILGKIVGRGNVTDELLSAYRRVKDYSDVNGGGELSPQTLAVVCFMVGVKPLPVVPVDPEKKPDDKPPADKK